MNSLMLKTGGKISYRFNVMISSKRKTNWILPHAVYSFPSALQGDKYCMQPSLCGSELFIVVWKMSFKYMNYVCPEAVNEMLKWAPCHRCQKSERQTVSGLSLREQKKGDNSLQRCLTATLLDACETMILNKVFIHKHFYWHIRAILFYIKLCLYLELIPQFTYL